jgi:integrase
LMKAPAPSAMTPRGPLTFAQLADRYEMKGFDGRSAGYKRDALAAIRRIAAVLGPEMPIADLKPSDVQRYVAYRLAERNKLRVAHRADVVALKIACNWAVGEELLPLSPFDAFKRKRGVLPPKSTPRRPFVTQERYDAMLAAARKFPPMFGVLLTLAWETGHRLSAILELQWSDVVIGKTRGDGMIRWYPGADTNKRFEHTLPMNAKAREALLIWQKESPGVGDTRLFPPSAREFAKRTFRKAERAAKLPHLAQGGWHMLRRGWATKRKQFAIQEVALGGGWKDTATAALYQQVEPEKARAVINGGR